MFWKQIQIPETFLQVCHTGAFSCLTFFSVYVFFLLLLFGINKLIVTYKFFFSHNTDFSSKITSVCRNSEKSSEWWDMNSEFGGGGGGGGLNCDINSCN